MGARHSGPPPSARRGAQRTETLALVLSGADSRDDRILRLLTGDDELVAAVARFARKSNHRGSLGARLQPLTLVRVELSQSPERELATVLGAQVERPFATLKADLARLALASAMAEVILHILPEQAREEGLYALTLRALTHLDDAKTTPRQELFLLFLLRVLDLQGVLPPLDELVEIPERARGALDQWRQGRFMPLEDHELGPTSRFLEGALSSLSGRPLLSRTLIDTAFGG